MNFKPKLIQATITILLISVVVLGYLYFLEINKEEPSPTVSPNIFIASSTELIASENHEEKPTKEPFYLKTIADLKNILIVEKINFMEINLDEMKVRVHEEGNLVKEVPVLAKGDPFEWGGTAAGLYNALSKTRIAFSVISDVYMPYAVHFYGKYFLHGEPYYPNGKKLISDVSGGCIRLLNENAKEIYSLIEKQLPILVIDKENDGYEYPEKINYFPEATAKSYLIADLDSGYVFAEKNYEEVLPIASLTKLMTAVVVSEKIDLTKEIKVTAEMLEAYGTTEGLEEGEKFRVVELFYPLLIESSNDSAEILASFLGRKTTIDLMNKKAEAILMTDTHFVDPSGLDPKNVSTAKDLFHLARYILNNRPLFLNITKGQEVRDFGEIKFNIKEFWNKNVFIVDPSFIGGKTGFIKASKDTAVFIFKMVTKEGESRNIAIILLGSNNNKTDTQRIYRWLINNYSLLPGT